jgi:GNAT superfamily N-acetyltransferase
MTNVDIVSCVPEENWRIVRKFRLLAMQNSSVYPMSAARKAKDMSSRQWFDKVSRIVTTDALWFATINETPVGMLWCHLEEESIAELSWLFVEREWRKFGVARKLVDHAETYAASKGAKRLRADIACVNTASQALFTSAGFIVEPDSALWWGRYRGRMVVKRRRDH